MFEYMTIDIHSIDGRLVDVLNNLSRKGWQVCAMNARTVILERKRANER